MSSDTLKRALITGASARGGAAIARALHRRGLAVVVHHSRRSFTAANEIVCALNEARADSATGWSADLEDPGFDVQALARAGDIDVCVCNASVWERGSIDDLERARRDWQVHVGAHARILAALRPTLHSVVGVTDIHVERPLPGYVWYTTAKAGLQALILALATEWAPAVRSNIVQPGILTPPAGPCSEGERPSLDTVPLGREGSFEELADAVTWLALDASYVTGQVLAVDGGRSRGLR